MRTQTRRIGSRTSKPVSTKPARSAMPSRPSWPAGKPAGNPKGPKEMALPTNAFATYEAIGNREDLSEKIYRIDPTDTPFMTGIEKAKATAVNHEWQTQALAAASGSNFQLEGDDVTADAATPTVRLGNIAQISRKSPRVTGTQQAVDHAGRDNEMAYQEMLKGMELKRDMETTLAGTNQAKVTGADATPRK